MSITDTSTALTEQTDKGSITQDILIMHMTDMYCTLKRSVQGSAFQVEFIVILSDTVHTIKNIKQAQRQYSVSTVNLSKVHCLM